MQVRVLGAHNLESRTTRHACLLVDGVLGIDAGSLASALSLAEQRDVRAVLLTHRHFDHVRDLPTLGLATLDDQRAIEVFGLDDTLRSVRAHLMDGEVYPDMTLGLNGQPPKYRFNPLRAGQSLKVLGYQVKAVSVTHAVPAVGYIVRDGSGGSVAYTGDTGGDLAAFFQDELAPRVLFVDVTFPDRFEQRAKLTGHLTPDMLRRQLERARKAGEALPRVVPIHLSMPHAEELAEELKVAGDALGMDLRPAHEDMMIDVTR